MPTGHLKSAAALLVAGGAALMFAADREPDGLTLPPGFHATVVAEPLGSIRHLAVRDNGDIYVNTASDTQNKGTGIIAIRPDAKHKADQVEHFGAVDGGTGIRFYKGALYASSPSGVYRFTFSGNELVPHTEPVAIVQGMPDAHPGFNRTNRPIAFDGKGNLFVALDASANLCTETLIPLGGQANAPVGVKPCPDLTTRAGVWRFSADKAGQKFPADGDQWATGIRDIGALDWSPADGHLYGIMHGRDSTNRFWPQLVSAEDDDHIADEMHRITKLTDFGWPYTYYDGVRKLRLVAPEYGGDGKTAATGGNYSAPMLTFHSRRAAPVDLMFATGSKLPETYRNGAFIVLHGTANRSGYNIVFVPFDHKGKAGEPGVFADGFAAFAASGSNPPRAAYRPIGIAEAPDGALYVADSQKGRIWRIAYESTPVH